MPTTILAADADRGRLLIARALTTGLEPLQTLTHLAVGDGPGTAAPDSAATGLQHELGRALFLERKFVVADPAGPILGGWRASADPTTDIYFLFRFFDSEAIGNWSEFLLCGGGIGYVARSALLTDLTAGVGDDPANVGVLLGGGYAGPDNQTVTVTVTTAGGSGAAKIGWSASGTIGAASNVTVAAGTPIVIGAGLTLTFPLALPSDQQLTIGAQWQIRATRDPDSPTFASRGVYVPGVNEQGQVQVAGEPVRFWHVDPPAAKGAVTVDVPFVYSVIRAA